MPPIPDRSVFLHALLAWERGDFAGLMRFFSDDVIYLVNVDGMAVPYAMSAVGKNDVSDRLQLLLDTFEVTNFTVENLARDGESTRALIHGIYRHRQTGEVLDIHVRFRGFVRDGLLYRVEETQDARYIEAFERLVFHLQTAAADKL